MRLTRTAQFNNPYSLRWPLVGMLLMLMLLGHDALTNIEAKAGQFVLPGSLANATFDHNTDHVADDGSTSPTPDRHLAHPNTDCGVNANIATLQSSSFSTQVFPPTVAVTGPPISIGVDVRAASEPNISPSVRRALLQVYLI